MRATRVTSLQVARRAGVSQSAVSRVFTPGASASPQTIANVRKAAAELGYRPNVLARAMVSGRSRIIGLVVAYLDNQFYPLALERLSNALQARGYHILMFTAGNTQHGIDAVLQDLMDYQVDGLIAASVSLSSDLASRARQSGVPIVLFNRGQDDAECINVTSDNFSGGCKAAEHLLQLGHQRIAHIAGWQGSTTGRDRQAGFLSVLDQAGVAPVALVDGEYQQSVAAALTHELFQRPNEPDALFVGNDHMAFAVLDALRGLGIRPGHDVSVIGFDDVPMSSWPAYQLSTVRQPLNRMVDATVERLLACIENPAAPAESIAFDGELIVRSSTCPEPS